MQGRTACDLGPAGSSVHDYTGTVPGARRSGRPVPADRISLPADPRTRLRRPNYEDMKGPQRNPQCVYLWSTPLLVGMR